MAVQPTIKKTKDKKKPQAGALTQTKTAVNEKAYPSGR